MHWRTSCIWSLSALSSADMSTGGASAARPNPATNKDPITHNAPRHSVRIAPSGKSAGFLYRMAMHLIQIPAEAIDGLWPLVARMIAPALAYAHGATSLTAEREQLLARKKQL